MCPKDLALVMFLVMKKKKSFLKRLEVQVAFFFGGGGGGGFVRQKKMPINLFPVYEKRIDKSSFLVYSLAYVVYEFNMQGELTYGKIGEWRFDKRSYDNTIPPRNLPLPPPGVPESVVCFLSPLKSQAYCYLIFIPKILKT